MRIALGLEYDGSAFCGWQTQPGGCAVQDHLQAGLAQIAGHPIEVTAAGRTDAGVHATSQVVHFDTQADRDDNAWVRGTNSTLTPALRVLWSLGVPDDFHARYSARSRMYRYVLLNEPVAPAVMRGRVGWYHRPLDLGAMREATQILEGEHDFSSFRDAQCQAKSPLRNLQQASVEQAGNLFVFTFRNAFLHRMVRNMMGCLVYGCRSISPDGWGLIFARDGGRPRPRSPDGLYLSGVGVFPRSVFPSSAKYPADRTRAHQICTQGPETRGRRGGRRPTRSGSCSSRSRVRDRGAREKSFDAAAVRDTGTLRECEATEIRAILKEVPSACNSRANEGAFCSKFGVPYVRAVRMEEGVDLVEYRHRFSGAKALMVDAHVPGQRGGTGQVFDWAKLPSKHPAPLILSGGLTAGNVGRAIREVRPWAVDVSSGVESSRGVKDPAKIIEFIRSVRREDAGQSA